MYRRCCCCRYVCTVGFLPLLEASHTQIAHLRTASIRRGAALTFNGCNSNHRAARIAMNSDEALTRYVLEARLREQISSLCCIEGFGFTGAVGLRLTRDYLRKKRRARLGAPGPSTPFSRLLGPVLLTNTEEMQKPQGFISKLTGAAAPQETATADALGEPGSITALYFTGKGVEQILEVAITLSASYTFFQSSRVCSLRLTVAPMD